MAGHSGNTTSANAAKAQEAIERMRSEAEDRLNLDVTAEEARALHRVVRAMHDGHCPKCGHLGTSIEFLVVDMYGCFHKCPNCGFAVSEHEAKAALAAFHPYLSKSVDVFERWRSSRGEGREDS